jgi:cytochrome c
MAQNLRTVDEQERRMRVVVAMAMVAGLLLASEARAGDAATGAGLTQRWCSGCHVIGSSSHGQDAAPTLPRPDRDRSWLRGWLTAPHPPMPDLHLSRQEIDDIIAYLSSLPQS